MLAQMTAAGFNVDLVHPGETFVLEGSTFRVFDSPGGTEQNSFDLESEERQETIEDTRRSLEGLSRTMAAEMAMETYVLYTTAVAGADVQNWEQEKDVFIDAVFSVTAEQSKFDDQRTAVETAEKESGKHSAPYNRAMIDYLKAVQDLAGPQGDMEEFWEWVHETMHPSEGTEHPGEYTSPPAKEKQTPDEKLQKDWEGVETNMRDLIQKLNNPEGDESEPLDPPIQMVIETKGRRGNDKKITLSRGSFDTTVNITVVGHGKEEYNEDRIMGRFNDAVDYLNEEYDSEAESLEERDQNLDDRLKKRSDNIDKKIEGAEEKGKEKKERRLRGRKEKS